MVATLPRTVVTKNWKFLGKVALSELVCPKAVGTESSVQCIISLESLERASDTSLDTVAISILNDNLWL